METDPNDEWIERLFDAARKAEPYNSEGEIGFETRLMAKIRTQRSGEIPFLLWAWRLIPVFASLVLFLGIWSYASETHDLADLNALAKIGNEETVLTAFLTGE
ncbi:MAG TPA: hypothetical protein VFG09_05790 [Thermodesulfovibrionales bacterium]|nr:hypothetical protein [Thermodesulfovibrionales bacterium]